MEAIPQDERVCTKCGRNQPISRFKRRSRSQGLRLSWCKDCVNKSARDRAARQKSQLFEKVVRDIQHSDGATRLESVISAARRKFSGVNGFAIKIAEVIQSPNMNTRLNAAKFFLKLVEISHHAKQEV